MSQAGASVVLVLLMLGLAGYWVFVPPRGFDETIGHRLTVPLVLVCCALMIFENLRTRAHMAQIVGALRSLVGRKGAPPPEVKREAVEILLKSLRSEQESVRVTALRQLEQLTGQKLGPDAAAWEGWWKANRESFR